MKRFLLFSLLFSTSLFADRFPELQKQLREAQEQLEQAEAYTPEGYAEAAAPPGEGHMTGDWYGWRTCLANKGVEFISSFVTDMVGNPVGGKARGFTYTGSYGLGMNIDFEKALCIKGMAFTVTAVWRTGTSLTLSKIKNQFNVQQVFGSQTVKLDELFLYQSFLDKRIVLKLGRLDAGNDFLQSNLYYQYVNNAFDGNPVAIFNNFAFTAYPNATWGAYFAVGPFKRVLGKMAVFNANTNIAKNKYHGINFTFKNTNGVIWITEWGYQVNQEKGDTGMPGNYRVGFLYQTGPVSKFLNGTVRGDPGFYVLLDQMIYRPNTCKKTNRGLTPFVALLFAPKDKNLFPFFYTAGLVYQGPLACRPDDSVNLGMAYGKYSSDLAKSQRRAGKEAQNFETVIELNYWIQVNKWFTITPDLQYVIHPSGLNIPNAFCLGAQIGIVL